jgi:hypothetical protein
MSTTHTNQNTMRLVPVYYLLHASDHAYFPREKAPALVPDRPARRPLRSISEIADAPLTRRQFRLWILSSRYRLQLQLHHLVDDIRKTDLSMPETLVRTPSLALTRIPNLLRPLPSLSQGSDQEQSVPSPYPQQTSSSRQSCA